MLTSRFERQESRKHQRPESRKHTKLGADEKPRKAEVQVIPSFGKAVKSVLKSDDDEKIQKMTHNFVKHFKGTNKVILKEEVKPALGLYDSMDVLRITNQLKREHEEEIKRIQLQAEREANQRAQQFIRENKEAIKAQMEEKIYQEAGFMVGFICSDHHCEYDKRLKQSK